MLNIENKERFAQTVSQAIERAAFTVENEYQAQRWIKAIERAAELVETQSEFITWFDDSQSVLVFNLETNQVYTANGDCECKAFKRSYPCKHRALARLLKRYYDEPAPSQAPGAEAQELTYLPPSKRSKVELVGNIRIN